MPLPSCGREPSLETGARGVRPEAGRCCALGPRGPCSALPVTLGHSIIRPLAPRRDVGGRADPQGPEPLLGTALPCTETAWHPTWHPQKPWPPQTQAGRREGPWEQPCVPPFPDGTQGTASPVHPGRQGRGGGTPVCCGQGPPQRVSEGRNRRRSRGGGWPASPSTVGHGSERRAYPWAMQATDFCRKGRMA